MADLIYPDIRIESYFTYGWVVSGTTDILYANGTLSGIIGTGALNFIVGYRGVDFLFPIGSLRAFLDEPGRYIPYPSSLTMKDFPQFVSETDLSFDVKANLYCSNGTVYEPTVNELLITSSDPTIMSVFNNTLTPLTPGTALITASLFGVSTSLPVIVLASDKKLFEQVDSAGLFPWN